MLVLSRKKGEQIRIGECVILTVLESRNGRVRLGFEAPEEVEIFREEARSEFREIALPEGRAKARDDGLGH
jgi:carbon storage regulator